MLKEDEERNERKISYTIDTCSVFEDSSPIREFSEALKKGELDGKRIIGEIVIPDVVQREVNKYYFKLIRRQSKVNERYSELIRKQGKKEGVLSKIFFTLLGRGKPEETLKEALEDLEEKEEIRDLKEEKDLFEKAKKAKILLNEELGKSPAWRLKKETNDIVAAARMLQDELGLYDEVENPPSWNDLLILATAMEIEYRGRPGPPNSVLITRDTGLKNAVFFVNIQRHYRVFFKPNFKNPWIQKSNKNNKKGD